MDITRFCLEVDRYQERTNQTQEETAQAMGVSLPYLRNVLYKSKPLTLNLVEKAAPVLGLTVQDFLQGVTPPPPGTDPATPFDPSFASIMGFLGPNMTDEMKKYLIGIARAQQPAGVVLGLEPAIDEQLGQPVLVGNLSTEALEKKAKAERQERKKVSEDGRVAKPTTRPTKKAPQLLLGKTAQPTKKKAKP